MMVCFPGTDAAQTTTSPATESVANPNHLEILRRSDGIPVLNMEAVNQIFREREQQMNALCATPGTTLGAIFGTPLGATLSATLGATQSATQSATLGATQSTTSTTSTPSTTSSQSVKRYCRPVWMQTDPHQFLKRNGGEFGTPRPVMSCEQ